MSQYTRLAFEFTCTCDITFGSSIYMTCMLNEAEFRISIKVKQK